MQQTGTFEGKAFHCTSLVMQPSLLISYRLKAHWSFSVSEPLSSTDRPITKSWRGEEVEQVIGMAKIDCSGRFYAREEMTLLSRSSAYLKTDRAISVHVKSVEQEMCICGGI
jgi:hypothetical protein